MVFEVSGSGSAQNVTWGVNGNQSQRTDATLPFREEVADPGSFAVASMVAQNGGSRSISCKVSRGGDVLAEQTSSGQYAVVTCSGS